MSEKKQELLETGDVLKTHPFEGYWGCALVLTAREKVDRSDPMCHIGITSAIFRHDYAFDELDLPNLKILQIDRKYRAAPNTYVPLHRETCIGIYSRKINSSVNRIGKIDISSFIPCKLLFEAGNGSDGGWPFCGSVSKWLGSDAVHAWRAVNDREQWLLDMAAADKSHEDMLIRIKEEGRQKRLTAKAARMRK